MDNFNCFLGLFAFDMGREQPEQARTRVILNQSLLNKPVKVLKADPLLIKVLPTTCFMRINYCFVMSNRSTLGVFLRRGFFYRVAHSPLILRKEIAYSEKN